MKALHKAAIIMKIALRFRKAIFGAPSGTRTQDPLIKSQLLYLVTNSNGVGSTLLQNFRYTIQSYHYRALLDASNPLA